MLCYLDSRDVLFLRYRLSVIESYDMTCAIYSVFCVCLLVLVHLFTLPSPIIRLVLLFLYLIWLVTFGRQLVIFTFFI